MKTVEFTYTTDKGIYAHKCSEPGNQSGLYIKAELVREIYERFNQSGVQDDTDILNALKELWEEQ